MTQGAREHPDVTEAVKTFLALKGSKPPATITEVARRFKIDRSTLSKALSEPRMKRRNGRK